MAIISTLVPVSLTTYFDPTTGAPLAVDAYFYKAGTLDPIPVYKGSDLSVPWDSPVKSTGWGRLPAIYIGAVADPGYRIRVFDQYSQLVEDLDGIPGFVQPTGGGGGGSVEPDDPHLMRTGQLILHAGKPVPRDGAVLANGLTIGSATSSATGRANDDTHDLFVHLWGSDDFGLLPVLPSRGVSAEGDWLANKTITLPDYQCMTFVGMDGMGVAATGRLTGVPMASGADLPARPFAKGGSALVTLTAATMPTHAHVLTDPQHQHTVSIPAHGHVFYSGVTSVAGNHAHSGGTDAQGAHAHNYISGDTQSNYGGGPSLSGSPPIGRATDVQGLHAHNLIINAAGDHQHAVSGLITNYTGQDVSTYGSATGITMANTGDGGAHNNTPLFATLSVYVVL